LIALDILDIKITEDKNMIIFQDEFMKSKGKPISYNNKSILMIDDFTLPARTCKIEFIIISTNSEWKQGFELTTNGKMKINNGIVDNGTRIWEHTAPKSSIIEVDSKDKKITVTNIWDHGDGVTQKWHNGGALYFEEIKNGKRYYCNDGHPNDDFTDLIFELTIIDNE
jgi:hypothetical protein